MPGDRAHLRPRPLRPRRGRAGRGTALSADRRGGEAQALEGTAPEHHPFVAAPHRTLVTLSVPVMLSLVAEPLTGLVDTAFVARLGAAELAALGVGTVLLSSTLWVFNFLGIGTQTEVSQAIGARDPTRARAASGTALTLSTLLGVGLAALYWPLLDPLAGFMGATGIVGEHAVDYLEIRLIGAPPMLAMMAAFGSLRGLHDMRTPLAIAVATNVLNVGLDAVLIFGAGPIPALGIAGAAWATVIAQWLGGAWAVAAVGRQLGLPERLDLRGAGTLLVVGRDLVLRTGLLISFIVLGTRAATHIGIESGAAHQVIRQFWLLTALALDAFAAAAQTLVGHFLGAGRPELALRVARVASLWALGSGFAIAAGMLAGEGAVAAAMVPAAALSVFGPAWWIAAVAQPVNALSFVTDGIHWAGRDYRYLRNGMFVATAVGAMALLAPGSPFGASLIGVWVATAGWIAIRAVFGVVRIWPGIGDAPLRATLR